MAVSRSEGDPLEMYCYTTLGTSLQNTLDLFVQNGRISENLRASFMTAFKGATHEVMTEQVSLQGNLRGKMNTYRNNQGVYTFYVENAKLQTGDHNYNAQILKIVCVEEAKVTAVPGRRALSSEPVKRRKR